MATSERPAQNVEDAEPKETRQAPYNRQTTNFGYPIYREPRAGGQRVLVRRPSVDLAQLTRQRSRAIIENFFRKSSPPVLEGLSDDFLDKISDVELRKVRSFNVYLLPRKYYTGRLLYVFVLTIAPRITSVWELVCFYWMKYFANLSTLCHDDAHF